MIRRLRVIRGLKKAWPMVCRMSVAAAVTYLYSLWAIEQAYIQRGYKAYGGEYLLLPLVAWGVYDALTVVAKISHAVRAWRKERKAYEGQLP